MQGDDGADDGVVQSLRSEVELIRSSLLPDETLRVLTPDGIRDDQSSLGVLEPPDHLSIPVTLDLSSTLHARSLKTIIHAYPIRSREDVGFQVRAPTLDREEAVRWAKWVDERLEHGWEEAVDSGVVLYTSVVSVLLPGLQEELQSAKETTDADAPAADSAPAPAAKHAPDGNSDTATEVLFTSHHLLAPSKRRDLHSLSSTLDLYGFAKTGHPGIIYALCPSEREAKEFVREVKSWQWLALKLRVVQSVGEDVVRDVKGRRQGAAGKSRGQWTEVEKMGDAIGWMKQRNREFLLLDTGFGAGPKG